MRSCTGLINRKETKLLNETDGNWQPRYYQHVSFEFEMNIQVCYFLNCHKLLLDG